MEKATIYTGTGDSGTTSLADGTRVAKDCLLVESYGTLDELNAHIGLLEAAVDISKTREMLACIENSIFSIGCHIAAKGKSQCPVTAESIASIEQAIDTVQATLPAIRSFLPPPGNEAAARANVCRTICRRAERRLTTLQKEVHIEQTVMAYINRLSDYFFLLQRQLTEGEEKKWEKPCK